MPSALATMRSMHLTHGRGLGSFAIGTVAGAGAGFAIGVGYGAWYGKWYGKWLPALVAGAGKLAALAAYLVSGGRAVKTAIALNDVGQAGVDVLTFGLGVPVGLQIAKKQLTVKDEKAALAAGEVRIAGELPPADPGRSLENISVEDFANLS